MKIAIIDSGVDVNHKRLQGARIQGVSIKKEGNNFIYDEDYNDTLGHGTGITSIIYRHYPEAELFIVKIFHDQLQCSESIVVEAIKRCIEKNIRIINLSLGIQTNALPIKLQEICKLANEKGIILVAASGKEPDKKFYPAYFNEVFGIASGFIKNRTQFGKIDNSPIEFVAKGNMQRVANTNNSFFLSDGSSYACAHFAGIIAREIEDNNLKLENSELKNYLRARASNEIKPFYNTKSMQIDPIVISENSENEAFKLIGESRFSWVGKIAIFPVSEKENRLFIDLRKHCNYQVTKYFDYPNRIKIKENHPNGIHIQDWMPNEKEFNEFDTLVIGYFHEHLFEGNVSFGFNLIRNAIRHNKNLFVYDSGLARKIKQEFISPEYAGIIYNPEVTPQHLKEISAFSFNKKINTPVIGVIGTGSKQGKFTVQLRLKEILYSEGYKVSHLSTEPHGELFGAISSFPFGYNSSVSIQQWNWANYIKSLIRGIEKNYEVHILISGIQSWTISPIGYPSTNGSEFKALYYLLGLEPDLVICTIGPYDELEVINKNINALNIILNSKILCYAITPLFTKIAKNKDGSIYYKTRMLNKEEFEQRIEHYNKILHAPVLNIMDTKNDNFLLKEIESFFSN